MPNKSLALGFQGVYCPPFRQSVCHINKINCYEINKNLLWNK